jgi:hypothetical protein
LPVNAPGSGRREQLLTEYGAQPPARPDPALVRTLWALHSAVFTLNLVAIGAALLGLGRAATLAGLTPRWMGPASAIGALLLAAAAAPAVAEVNGSRLLALGLLGFACWLVLLGTSSAALLTGARRSSTSPSQGG